MRKEFEVTGPIELDVRLPAGEIELDATLAGRAEVELIAHDDEAQKRVDEARVELSGNRLLIEVPKQRGSLVFRFGGRGITCRVACPDRSSAAVKTGSADVRAHGTLGGLDVATASGDVEADVVDGDARVKSASGDVSIREVTGRFSHQSASGDAEVRVVRGAADAATASGDLAIDEAWSDVRANTASGDLRLGAVVRGTVSANAVSGDVEIGVRRGSNVYLDCNTVSGDTRSDLDHTGELPAGDAPLVEIKARTVSGDIHIMRAPAPAPDAQEVH